MPDHLGAEADRPPADKDPCPRPPSGPDLLKGLDSKDYRRRARFRWWRSFRDLVRGTLGFEPYRPMVRWFSPVELLRAGFEALVSSLFGAYADNREIQAIRTDLAPVHYTVRDPDPAFPEADDSILDRDEIWIDYVADLGDGFNPTYAVARLLAAERLALPDGDAEVVTERGRILVLGGDQVYPTAKREEYQNRFEGPYRAALPCVDPAVGTPPHLYAVPGNHDWYDGLTSFTRLFCQGRWIGGWKTKQTRSYFALELPHNWWLWGIDVQLSADIDQPQKEYFEWVGSQMEPGAKIILCTAVPSWIETDDRGLGAYDVLSWFEAKAMQGHHHVVGLAGDLHAYARYHDEDGLRQRFVSGGGGAYLYPTHRFPDTLCLPTEPAPAPYRRTEMFHLGTKGEDREEALFPPRSASWRLAFGSLAFPFQNWRFAAFFGAFYGFLAWLVQSASKTENDSQATFFETLAGLKDEVMQVPSWLEAWPAAVQDLGARFFHLADILAHAPLGFLTSLVLFLGLVAFSNSMSTLGKVIIGGVHTVTHLLMFIALCWLFAWVNLVWIAGGAEAPVLSAEDPLLIVLFAVEFLLLGGIAAGFVWGAYLFGMHLFKRHTNDVFACQSLESYKHILRLHIDTRGDLTIYPIGLRDVPKDWVYRPEADRGAPWFEPVGTPIAERAELIEPPIRVPASAFEGPPD